VRSLGGKKEDEGGTEGGLVVGPREQNVVLVEVTVMLNSAGNTAVKNLVSPFATERVLPNGAVGVGLLKARRDSVGFPFERPTLCFGLVRGTVTDH
jgi:hypothetical protein